MPQGSGVARTSELISRLRIASGVVLFLFVLMHLISIAVGLFGLEAMEAARPVLMGIWSNPIGGPILLLSFITHAALGLYTLYRRNTLLMNWRDGSQALLGMAIVPLLLPHIMGVGIGPRLSGMEPTFEWVLAVYWLWAPGLGIQQVLALVVIWVHGCYGLLLWLQVQERLGWTVGLIWPFVVVVPVSALLGFVEAGKQIYQGRDNPELMAPVLEQAKLYEPYAEQLWSIHDTILWSYLIILLAVLAARFLRLRRRESEVVVRYGDDVCIRRPAGLSLLELARLENLPHAALCGARGRCGSCAVRVLEGEGCLSPIEAQEAGSLARTAAPEGARLACQAMPTGGDVKVERLYDARLLPAEYRALVRARRDPAPVQDPIEASPEGLPDEAEART